MPALSFTLQNNLIFKNLTKKRKNYYILQSQIGYDILHLKDSILTQLLYEMKFLWNFDKLLTDIRIILFLQLILKMEAIVEAKPYLVISNGLFLLPKRREAVQKMSEVQCKRVELNHNYADKIIKQISHINFIGTQFMQLSYNDITSIQSIRYLNAPFLKDLHLSYNYITEVLSLAKASFPKLQALSLMSNPIADRSRLQIMHFPALNKLLLDDPKSTQKLSFHNSLDFSKSYPPYIPLIRFTQRIKQSNVDAMLLRRKKVL